MISLIAESLHFPHLFAGNSLQPEITPNSKMCLEEARFFPQTHVHAWCNLRELFCEGTLNPFNFNFVSVHFGVSLPVGAASRFPSALKSLPVTGMKHHSPLSHMMSIEQRLSAEPRAKLSFNFNVYQNSNREETDRVLRVKQFDTAGVPRTSGDRAFQTTARRITMWDIYMTLCV